MKKWLTHLAIAAYLSALAWGIVAHTFGFKNNAHPAMYYVVWDMFCGWGSYSNRMQVIAEGESGEFYQVTPAPWGTIKPFGKLDRRHYDFYGVAINRIAMNVLKHTEHEPISRIYVLDECWPKKFNIPDKLWNERYTEAKDPHHYFHVRYVIAGDGTLVEQNPNWFQYQQMVAVSSNPRLVQELERSRPMYAVNPLNYSRTAVANWDLDPSSNTPSPRSSAHLGN